MEFLQNGIKIKDKEVILEWGKPVDKLASNYGAIVEKHGENYYAY